LAWWSCSTITHRWSCEFGLCELTRGALHGVRIRAAWHRQHDVERFAPVADLVDERTAETPLVDQVVQGVLPLVIDPPVVLDGEQTVLADVSEVRRDGGHPATTTRDLDHHLRSARRHRRVNAVANALRPLPDRTAQSRQRACLDDSIAGIEKALAPLNQLAVH
jgi:hypothetical protein